MNKVHIELKRVQTWLFSIPRLRAMVGANTLLGETLRVELKKLMVDGNENDRWKTQAHEGDFPAASDDDPLEEHDDPRADAALGITSRDGGHFEAYFDDEEGAEAFAREAAALLRERLPGLQFKITAGERKDDEGEGDESTSPAFQLLGERARFLSSDLPVLAPCSWTGRGLSSAVVEQGEDLDEVSLDACERHTTAKRAEEGNAEDLVTLMRRAIGSKRELADTFEELAESGYLAVIHADGNGVGSALCRNPPPASRAKLHHNNRVLMRSALKHALLQSESLRACRNLRKHGRPREVAPLLPLMLGGDDLLVVCRADAALPFVVDLCSKLECLQPAGESFRLTLGIGVAIASYSLPFHDLHEVAEQLATSAKRRVRTADGSPRVSVVDWAVSTASLAEKNLAAQRRRDWLCGPAQEPRRLSQRPLPVLARDGGQHSLEGLLAGTRQLEGAPRSQLLYLMDQLRRGKKLAELAFEELSPPARRGLERAGMKSVWIEANDGGCATALLDLIEVMEIGKLGASERTARHE
jgi:hypothetical protein